MEAVNRLLGNGGGLVLRAYHLIGILKHVVLFHPQSHSVNGGFSTFTDRDIETLQKGETSSKVG